MYVDTDISVRTMDCMEIIVWKRRVRGGQEIRGIINKFTFLEKPFPSYTKYIALHDVHKAPICFFGFVLAPSQNASSLLLLKVTLLLLILAP